MKIKQIAKIQNGQDGAIFGNQLFRFNTRGDSVVYDLSEMDPDNVKELQPIGRFVLDKSELIVPHSNAVSFGAEYFDPSDEYPLLYTNIYNNYANKVSLSVYCKSVMEVKICEYEPTWNLSWG